MKHAFTALLLLLALGCTTKVAEKPLSSSPPVETPPLPTQTTNAPALPVEAQPLPLGQGDALREVQRFGGSPLVADEEARVVVFSPDGKLLATGGGGKRGKDILLWDAATGERLFALEINGEGVNDLEFSPDGRFLAASDLSRVLFVWDISTRKLLHELEHDKATLYHFDLSDDGQTIVTLDSEGRITAWDLRPAKPTSRLVHQGQFSTNISLSKDGKTAAVTAEDGHFWLIPTEPGKKPVDVNGDARRIHTLVFAKDGKTLLTGETSLDGKEGVSLRDAKTGARIRKLEGQSFMLDALWANDDLSLIASGSNAGQVMVWQGATGAARLSVHTTAQAPVWSVALSPDGKRIAAAGRARRLEVWSLETGAPVFPPSGHTEAILRIAYSPDGTLLASGDQQGLVIVRDAQTGAERARLPLMAFGIDSLAFSPDGKDLLTVAHGDARIWDVPRFEEKRRFSIGRLDALAFAPNGKALVASNETRIVRLLDAATGAEQKTFGQALPGDSMRQNLMTPSSVSFTKDGKEMAVARWDQPLQIWDVSTGALRKTLEGTLFATYSPTGEHLLAGHGHVAKRGTELSLQLFDVASGEALFAMDAKPPALFSPNGAWIATISSDEVSLWDAKTGKLHAHQPMVAQKPICLAFSPDGHRLATGGIDTTVRVFEVR